VARATCQILFAPGTWTTGATARYTVRRGGTVVARGNGRIGAHGRLRIRVARRLRSGRYRVTVTVGRKSLTRTVTVRSAL
jgi:hypothetical protein